MNSASQTLFASVVEARARCPRVKFDQLGEHPWRRATRCVHSRVLILHLPPPPPSGCPVDQGGGMDKRKVFVGKNFIYIEYYSLLSDWLSVSVDIYIYIPAHGIDIYSGRRIII